MDRNSSKNRSIIEWSKKSQHDLNPQINITLLQVPNGNGKSNSEVTQSISKSSNNLSKWVTDSEYTTTICNTAEHSGGSSIGLEVEESNGYFGVDRNYKSFGLFTGNPAFGGTDDSEDFSLESESSQGSVSSVPSSFIELSKKYRVLKDYRESFESPNSTVVFAERLDESRQVVVIKKVERGPFQYRKSPEIEALIAIRGHKEFIELQDYFYSHNNCFLILEFPGDEWVCLFDHLFESRPQGLTKNAVKTIFKGIVSAVLKLKGLGFVHRDIKGFKI